MPVRLSPFLRSLGLLSVLALVQQAALAQVSAPTAWGNEVWRVTSRLGYAPTPDWLATVPAQATGHVGEARGTQSWALQQIDAAQHASRQPAQVPARLEHLSLGLPEVFANARAAREARREVKAPTASAEMSSSSAQPPSPPPDQVFLREVTQQAMAWRLLSCSRPELEHPILARMTEFWFNHFNVFVGKGPVRPHVGHYLLNAIRPNALGKFEDLLLATAQHPAMLLYLDQAGSVADQAPARGAAAKNARRGLNENYARELMELHTLGVNGGYTQQDVTELARMLTGWTIDPQSAKGFRFNARQHDTGDKIWLGQKVRNGGLNEGLDAIQTLARHPATARRIALRMAQFFVSDKPPTAFVERLAQRFLNTGGDIALVLKTLVQSPEFWAADNALFKTPQDFVCSALAVKASQALPLRGLGSEQAMQQAAKLMEGAINTEETERLQAQVQRQEMNVVQGYLNVSGQALFAWQTPDGYSTDASTWMAPEALTRRADMAFALAQQGMSTPTYLWPFFSSATQSRIAQEKPKDQISLMLASPDFMRK
jgi:uncharacterized protein (DUF1800 family)